MTPLRQNELGRLLSRCPRRALPAGDALGPSDFPEATLLIVEKGIVVIASGMRAERRIALGFCSQGTLLLPPRAGERMAALADSTVISITPDVQQSLLRLPAAAEALLEALLDALRERQESLAQFAHVMHTERLRAKLIQLARAHGTVVADGIRVDLPLTHALLGQAVGSARETVTSALRALERDGFLVREGRRYRLTISPEILDQDAFGSWASRAM
jgi:CRP/FNR family transcriptional regulator, cyclic AMP receptor protein